MDYDSINKLCKILNIDCKNIVTFEDFIEFEFKKPYKKIKNKTEIKLLKKAWNTSCESLLSILKEIKNIER